MSINPKPNDENGRADSSSVDFDAGAPDKGVLVGETVGGRYLIERQLGHGGFGAVYLARDTQLVSRPVVVKVLLEKSLGNEWVLNKFRHEIEALARIDHPSIVGIFDAGKLPDGQPYIVMQYVEGVNLRSLIQPGGMDFQRAAHIIEQVARALDEAHNKDVFHRDLKPENIMVRALGSGEEQVKVIDFGIAKVKDSVMAPNTVTEMTVGTLAYMSPEQLSAKPISVGSDIYSLGVIAYELVTGRRPFNADNPVQLADMQRDGVKVKPIDLRPSLAPAAQAAILKAISLDPADRHQNIREFGEELGRALTAEGDHFAASTLEITRSDKPSGGDASGQPQDETQTRANTVNDSRLDVFISYSSKDKEVAEDVCATLEKNGINCWIAPRNIIPGRDWSEAIIEGINESRVMVLVLSAQANESHQVKREVERAVHKNIPIVPFRIERVPPSKALEYYLSTPHWLDAYTPPMSQHLQYLAETVKKLLHRSVPSGNIEPVIERKGKKKKSWLPGLILAGVVLAMIAVAGVFLLRGRLQEGTLNFNAANNSPPQRPTAERAFTYSLMVQKMRKVGNKKVPAEGRIPSTGGETFSNGSQFSFVFTPAQQGFLYLLNEGPGPKDSKVFNLLFPNLGDNGKSARIAADQRLETSPNVFGEHAGLEKIWIIWSVAAIPELESVVGDLSNNRGAIKDAAQIRLIEELLAKHDWTKFEAQTDENNKTVTIRGNAELLLRRLELRHDDF